MFYQTGVFAAARHKHRVILRRSVQRGYVGNFIGELFSKQGHLGAALAGRWHSQFSLPYSS